MNKSLKNDLKVVWFYNFKVYLYMEYCQIGPPFTAGDMVIVDWAFGNNIGGKTFVVQACEADDDCESGWLVYINGWLKPIDSNWFKKYQ